MAAAFRLLAERKRREFSAGRQILDQAQIELVADHLLRTLQPLDGSQGARAPIAWPDANQRKPAARTANLLDVDRCLGQGDCAGTASASSLGDDQARPEPGCT